MAQKKRKLSDPMPGYKTPAGIAMLVVAGALLFFGKLDVDQFLALAATAGALMGWGVAAKVERSR